MQNWHHLVPALVGAIGGLGAIIVAITLVRLFRGCQHEKMSWPVRRGEHAYQVCLACGTKRLFDEKQFCGYGNYSYDLDQLISEASVGRLRTT